MKSLRQKMVAMAAVVAVSGLMMASVAGAADKLIVKDSAGANTVFSVSDSGVVGAALWDTTTASPLAKFGVGTLAPTSTLTVVDEKAGGARGLAVGEYESSTNAAMLVFRKSRGGYGVSKQTPAQQLDYVGAFHGQVWDGSSWLTTATINYYIEGAVSTGVAPQALLFSTGTTPAAKVARIYIGSDGKISMGNGSSAATISGNGILDMNADAVRLRQSRVPASSTAACNQGEISWGPSYVYVCVATNTWKRIAYDTAAW
ncbi:hypothetical protein [Geotalea sp. SG265]|uniref:hypothetical protein n=1 Tax=Geotalea sp. SG265 TaxID=2922867 RepID=UPI001FB01C84|nr:hypothetical protein [Geotalea sp. SG265]